MKRSALTIGRRVALGFSLLLLLGAGLGGFAVIKMLNGAGGARFLANAVARQSEAATHLAEANTKVRLAAYTYGLTGDEKAHADAVKSLAEVDVALDAARKLSDAHPELTVLHTGVALAAKAHDSYRAQFKATEANRSAFATINVQLDTAVSGFDAAISSYIEAMEKQQALDIIDGLPADKLEERRLKVAQAYEIFNIAKIMQTAALKAMVLRDPELLDKSQSHFDRLESFRQKIVQVTRREANMKLIVAVGQTVASYRTSVEALAKNFTEAQTLQAARLVSSDELNTAITNILERATQRTLDDSATSANSLNMAARSMIGGLLVMVALGLVAAGLIIRGVNHALNRTATTLTEGSVQVASASAQVSSASQSLAAGSSEQAASLEEISSSVEELASMTKRNAENAQSGKTASGEARTAAETGAAEMERMQTAMNAIQQSSTDIGKIIKTIDEIAFQTNILALNAAVEAARAGESGAGFAVVADEVRALAQRSATAAKETAGKISDATTRSDQGVALSVKVAADLQHILVKSREVDRLVTEVATASTEQSEGISQISLAISQMDKVTQSNAASAEETASAAEELSAQSAELREAADQLSALVGGRAGKASTAATEPASAHPVAPLPDPAKSAAGEHTPQPTHLPTSHTQAHAEGVPHPKTSCAHAKGENQTLSFKD